MQKYLVNTTGFSKDDATLISTLGLLVFMLVQPIFGLVSDRIGRRAMLMAFGTGALVFTAPLLDQLSRPQSLLSAFSWYCCALLVTSGYSSVNAIVKAELFPVHVRALGVGFPYAITVSLFGGSAEYLALWTKTQNHPEWFAYYVSTLAGCTLLAAILMLEPKDNSAIEKETFG